MSTHTLEELIKLIEGVFGDTQHRRGYKQLIEICKEDKVDENGNILLGLRRAPGASKYHHTWEGGWVDHTMEMMNCWWLIRPKVDPVFLVPFNGHLSDQRILAAVINHDLHKANWGYELISSSPWEVKYAKSLSNATNHMGKNFHSLWLLMQHGVPMDELQVNALVNSEGGWSTTQSDWSSVLAKMAYLLDELSGNVFSRLQRGNLLDVRIEGKAREGAK